MDEPVRSQWQIRCAFNGYCSQTLRNEAANAHKHVAWRQSRYTSFSDLSPQKKNELYTSDSYFADDKTEQTFSVAGKEISAQAIADALHSLPEDKREAVLLYYFMDKTDAEIGKLLDIPRSTVQYRRTSSFELLKRYLEEHTYGEHDG